MPIIRNALSSVLGDHFPSSTERELQRQCENMQKNVRKANKSGTGSAVTIQALQTQLTYETVKEQRYARLGDVQQTERSRGVIAALQQQLAQYQPINPMSVSMLQPYLMRQTAYQPQLILSAQPYSPYGGNQLNQQQQLQPQCSQQYAAQPALYSTQPPVYVDSCEMME